ncbi:MAG: lycopene cyclase family protein [Ilumatobacter sp.]|uniref:lycopene cyclase family protein n=1 Tax=Ilumatobacter sp. TaxID=1967498 RepID=UPI002620EC54|nr:lycopene cyclase family protein [Ilumatobacter sp.]MDJ0769729.1 lycopene cyclase family protein [Ilumatobacter sp.]
MLHDVAIAGDGPAGAAIAAACADVGLDVVVVGPGEPWTNTYATWVDDVADVIDTTAVFAAPPLPALIRTTRDVAVDRRYGVFDNDSLREQLDIDARLRRGFAVDLTDHHGHAAITMTGGSVVEADVVVDARGASVATPVAWQTAYGVVVDEHVVDGRYPLDRVTVMDWSGNEQAAAPSFCYVVPLDDGWLVEETVLAATPAVEPNALRRRLARRIDEAAIEDAERHGRVETVRIPMGVPVDRGTGRVVRFGAAAGMIHPATGYSVAASLRAAPRVAQAIAAGADVHDAVWPASTRRARALHDYGLGALLRLDRDATTSFFDAFFGLGTDDWSAYLRVDSTGREVARVMRRVFAAVPWSVRRELVELDVNVVRRLLRP